MSASSSLDRTRHPQLAAAACTTCGKAYVLMRGGHALCNACVIAWDDAEKTRRSKREPLADKRALETEVADFIGRARDDMQVILGAPADSAETARILGARIDLLERALKAVRS